MDPSEDTPHIDKWAKIDDMTIARHEAKYIVDPTLIPEIRKFIAPFCARDPNGRGEFPEYTVNTIQLDSADLSLHYAKEVESKNRFKLRLRTYGEGGAAVFSEIKRKLGTNIIKSRAMIPWEYFGSDLFTDPRRYVPFRSMKEQMNYLDFMRLVRSLQARPVLIVRYRRESYIGENDHYARITFDRRIRYLMTKRWDFSDMKGGAWRTIDTATGLRSHFPGFILECKTQNDAPLWMIELVKEFSLTRVGFCKYSTGLRLELLSHGHTFSDTSENCTPASRW